MRNLVLITFIFLLSINSLFAQKREHIRVVPKLSHSYVLPLKHNKRDSLYHTRPQLKYIYLRHKNQHIDDPLVRYALDNLKKERMKYYELYKAINTLSDYAENEHIKYMLNYVRNYFETVQAKEEAIRQIEDRIKRDSVDFYKEHPEDSVQYDKLLNQNLKALLSFMDQDVNYQWLKEKSRDSVQITLLSASNRPKNLWLNTGKTQYYRFMAENFIGDTIGTWVKVMPRGNQLKFFLEDNYFQTSNYLKLCKDFVQEVYNQENDIPKADQIDMLNRSIDYFKKADTFNENLFKEEVVSDPQIIDAFENFKNYYEEKNELALKDQFDVSNSAVKDEKRYFKHVLKLDKNFHVYIHGQKKYIEKGYDSDRDMNYYKLYFREEN